MNESRDTGATGFIGGSDDTGDEAAVPPSAYPPRMPSTNVRLARARWRAFLRGDLEAALDGVDPAVEGFDIPGLPEGGSYQGHRGFLAQIDNVYRQFEAIRWEPAEFIDCGHQVVVVINFSARSRKTGTVAKMSFAQLDTYSDGRLVRIESFSHKEEALAVAELEPREVIGPP